MDNEFSLFSGNFDISPGHKEIALPETYAEKVKSEHEIKCKSCGTIFTLGVGESFNTCSGCRKCVRATSDPLCIGSRPEWFITREEYLHLVERIETLEAQVRAMIEKRHFDERKTTRTCKTCGKKCEMMYCRSCYAKKK